MLWSVRECTQLLWGQSCPRDLAKKMLLSGAMARASLLLWTGKLTWRALHPTDSSYFYYLSRLQFSRNTCKHTAATLDVALSTKLLSGEIVRIH